MKSVQRLGSVLASILLLAGCAEPESDDVPNAESAGGNADDAED